MTTIHLPVTPSSVPSSSLPSSPEKWANRYQEEAMPQAEAGAVTNLTLASSVIKDQNILLAKQPVILSSALLSTATISARPFATDLLISDTFKPTWQIAALPTLLIDPAPTEVPPVRAGNFFLWPDVVNQRAFFALAVPYLLDVSLTIQSSVLPGGNIRITGGMAIVTVGLYPQDSTQAIERQRQEWTSALSNAGYRLGKVGEAARRDEPWDTGILIKKPIDMKPIDMKPIDISPFPRPFPLPPAWNFQAQSLRNLRASLELPAGHLVDSPQISANTGAGAVTYVINLSETGALVWKSALEQQNGSAIPGICRITASYYGRSQNKVAVQEQSLSAPLGMLLANRGPSDIRIINPQQDVESRLIVVGHDLLNNISVAVTPTVGLAPASQVFGPSGGTIQLKVTTQDVQHVKVNWQAQVSFKPTGWPIIPASGQLAFENGWTEMIKPESWIANYTIVAILVDASGRPIVSSSVSDYRVNGVLTFTAPYIPVTRVLVSPFDATHQTPVTAALPRFPGQPFGDLVLNLFAMRAGQANTQSRRLSETDLFVVALVYPDAHIEIKTSTDTLPELSTASSMLGLLEQLR